MRRLPLYKTQGIVLLRRALGEKDKYVVLYTEKFGKIESQARGARRIKSRFSATIEPFSLIDLSLWMGDYTSIIRETKIIKSFLVLREDIEKIQIASFITKTINSLIEPFHPDRRIFQLLLEAFLWLEEKPDFLIKPFFIFKLLEILGIFPSFSKCILCSQKEIFGLNIKEGGPTCKEHLDSGVPLSKSCLKIINSLSKIPFSLGKRITIPNGIKEEIDEISNCLLMMHLQKN